jgi:hypothetical protein
MRNFSKILLLTAVLVLLTASCQRNIFQSPTVAPSTLRDVPALRLNFRFEPDVPAPSAAAAAAQQQQQPNEERVQSVQTDFDNNRTQEQLERTIVSPDKKRVLAVYRKVEDVRSQYRLDMYTPDGRLLRKITPNATAVHFIDTIVWSPDSNNVAFVGIVRAPNPADAMPTGSPTPPASEPTPAPDANANINGDAAEANTDANVNVAAAPTAQAPEPPAPVLTFRTEQLYLCNADGGDLKPLTQNEGLIYFYFVWAPDSSALVTLASTLPEWRTGEGMAEQRMEIFVPSGRPRLVEKNGRIRLLDDNLTKVRPVWSPDSAKIAVAFDKDVRVYDAIGNAPTQAAIPLKNPLLLSSQKFDDDLRAKEQGGNAAPTNANAAQVNTLPDESMLVSFNPITELEWTEPGMLYLQTAYVREMKNTPDSARSYARWHRLIFSPQAVAL